MGMSGSASFADEVCAVLKVAIEKTTL